MANFLIALLVVGTVFLLLGVIGRGVEAGSGTVVFKIEGKVGPFPRAVFVTFSVIDYVVTLILFVALLVSMHPSPGNGSGNSSPAPIGYSSNISPPNSPPNSSSQPISASQIAQDATGQSETGVNSNATVTYATCYPDTVQQTSDGSTQAECNLTLSNDVKMRSVVTDNVNGISFNDEYQQNLSASDIESAVMSRKTANNKTVTDSTCDPSTVQTNSNGSTQSQCTLTLFDGLSYNQYDTTVTYNGVSSPTWP
jgi:hypothetical protein